MALVHCKECGKEVAISAPTCPHCGVPYPGATKGKLVVYRAKVFAGSLRKLSLYLNEKEVATLSNEESFEVELPEGTYYLRAIIAGTKSEAYEITIQAGRTVKMNSWFEAGLFGYKLGFNKA